MNSVILEGSASATGTQAIARAAALLRELASSSGGERTLAEISRNLGLERPTVHRILRRLVDEKLVRQNPATRAYCLGPLIYELGLVAQPPSALYTLSDQSLNAIAEQSGDTAFAFVASAFDCVCFDRREGHYPVKALMLEVGRRRPMGIGASSLAMLAAMPADDANCLLETNSRRLRLAGESDVETLKQLVATARVEKYALKAPLVAPEIMSLAVAVRNRYGNPIMGLSISALRHRITRRLDSLLALLHAHASEMESVLQSVSPPPGSGIA
jgi:DNA-binding IclR family transcriptional regulator